MTPHTTKLKLLLFVSYSQRMLLLKVWKNLNAVIARHSVPKSIFKGFIIDSIHANRNAVRVIYGRYLC